MNKAMYDCPRPKCSCVPLQRCVEIQRASLASKRSTFGDLSVEVADTLQLIGSLEMSGGSLKQAHRTLTKAMPPTTQTNSTDDILTWSQAISAM